MSRAFLHDLLPQRVHQDRVRVSRAVNDGQLALRQFEMVSKLPIELQERTLFGMEILHTPQLLIISILLVLPWWCPWALSPTERWHFSLRDDGSTVWSGSPEFVLGCAPARMKTKTHKQSGYNNIFHWLINFFHCDWHHMHTSIFSSSSWRNSPSEAWAEMQEELLADRIARAMYSKRCFNEISVLHDQRTTTQNC